MPSSLHPGPAELVFILFWVPFTVCGMILVPQQGIEPVPPAVEARSLNHRMPRKSQN